jgi:hypothetical protein
LKDPINAVIDRKDAVSAAIDWKNPASNTIKTEDGINAAIAN